MNHAQRRSEQRKGFSKKWSKHHRRPRSRGGGSESENISLVPVNLHVAYHILFANMLPEEIVKVLNDMWIPRDWEIVARRR